MATISADMFFLDPSFQGTLQRQIQRIVSDGVVSGLFRPGDKMPSSRALAAHLGISRITVTIAYTDLVANDYLVSHGRSGYFVSEQAPAPPDVSALHTPDARPRLDPETPAVDWSSAIGQRFSHAPSIQRPADWLRYPYPFIYGQVDPYLFDHKNWRQCALQALGQRDFDALTSDYYERDDPELIEQIVQKILPRRGIYAPAEQVLLTIGAQNALWMAAQILLTAKRTAVIENPCYPGLREILQATQAQLVSQDVDSDGLSPEALPAETDAVFVTVSHQCPTNATMPLKRRRALLERAQQDRFIVVEDDYEVEIADLQTPSPALKALDRTGCVVYIGSFSKSLFPGLRLGFIVAPEPFIAEARALRSLVLRHPAGHVQRTAAYFLAFGHYDAQLNRIGQAYRRRRAAMTQAIKVTGIDAGSPALFGASSAWLRAPDGVSIQDVAAGLRRRGVLIEPGDAFFEGAENGSPYYRLAYSSIRSARIGPGVDIVAQELNAGRTGG